MKQNAGRSFAYEALHVSIAMRLWISQFLLETSRASLFTAFMMQLVSTSSFHCLWYEWVVSTDVEHFSYHRSICDLSLFRNGCFIASECSTQGASVTKTWSTNGGIPRLRREWSDKTVGAGKLSLDSPPEFRHCLWTMPFHQKQCTKSVGVITLLLAPEANLV